MTIKNLYPSFPPSLNLDFANSKRLDSRITFTRSSTGTYFGSDGLLKSAAVNEARFDHNPATGESLGLLVEEARTNSFTYSEEFDNAAWTKTNCSITANSTTAPNGLQVADTLTSSAAGTAVVLRSLTQNPSIFSVYLKANTSTVACVRILSNVSGRNVAYNVNLSAGTISAATGNTGNLTGWTEYTGIQNIGNGWYRVFIGFTSSTTFVTSDYEISPSLNRTAAASGESIFIWGAQAESGAFPTSYIATTTATVARSADVASMTASPYLYGTFLARYRQQPPAGLDRNIFTVGASNAYSGAFICQAKAANVLSLVVSPVADLLYTANTEPSGFNSVAAARVLGDYALCLNGGTVAKSTSTTDSANNSVITFMYGTIGVTSGGHVSRFTYWPVRLSDTILQELTR